MEKIKALKKAKKVGYPIEISRTLHDVNLNTIYECRAYWVIKMIMPNGQITEEVSHHW